VGKAVRISLKEEWRIFTPPYCSSYSWKRTYKKRIVVERVNTRLDVSFGLEHHCTRGHKKKRHRYTLVLCVMLAMALGSIKEK
jgi:hypothetical protein